MKTLDEIYAAALAVDPVSYRVGNEKFERFVQCATPVAVTGMIDEIRSLRQKLEAAEDENKEYAKQHEQDTKTIFKLSKESDELQQAISEAREQKPVAYIRLSENCNEIVVPKSQLDHLEENWKWIKKLWAGADPLYRHPVPAMPIPADHSEDIAKLNHVLKMNRDCMTTTGVVYIEQVIASLSPQSEVKPSC